MQGLGITPPTFRSEVQCPNHYTIATPLAVTPDVKFYATHPTKLASLKLNSRQGEKKSPLLIHDKANKFMI